MGCVAYLVTYKAEFKYIEYSATLSWGKCFFRWISQWLNTENYFFVDVRNPLPLPPTHTHQKKGKKTQPGFFSFWVATTPKKQRNNFSNWFLVFGFFVYLNLKSDLKIEDVTFWHFGISKTPFTWGNEPLHTCKSCQYFANLVWKKCIPSKWKVLPTSSTCYAWLQQGV